MSNVPSIKHPNGDLHPFNKKRLWMWLQKRGVSRTDAQSVVLRVKAELLAQGVKTIGLWTYRDLVDRATGEVTGTPVRRPATQGEPDRPVTAAAPPPATRSAPAQAGRPGKHFTWEEFERSHTAQSRGIDNSVPDWARDDVTALCAKVLDPLREHLGETLRITSGFRSDALNEAIGGAAGSQHMTGQAADAKTDSVLNGSHDARWLAKQVVAAGCDFDQLIWYHPSKGGHIHVSHNPDRATQRRETMYRDGSGYHPMTP